jgi:teichoic acid transport system ATP-binding protein
MLTVQHLSKIYRLYHRPSDRFKALLRPRAKYCRDFYALNDVSFKLARGQTLGVIGRNGSGKSTLLKIIAGILTPTAGEARVQGRVAALLELGAGFNPLMTGMENIYFSGTIMGFSRRDIDQRLDQIVDFAGIGDYLDQPVRTYSSGMFVRLAFAVAISVDPDILLVDEALAVGDMNFQAKCFRRIAGFRAAGKTVIFVTHALDTVIRYCDSAIVLEKGRLVAESDPKKAVDEYKKIMADSSAFTPEVGTKVADDTLSYGNKKALIIDCAIHDDFGRKTCLLENGKKFTIMMKIRFQTDIADPIFAFTIKDLKGLEVTGTNTEFKKRPSGSFHKGDTVEVRFEQALNMQSGKYALSLGCVGSDDSGLAVYHRLYDAVLFEVSSSMPMVGLYDLDSSVNIEVISEVSL